MDHNSQEDGLDISSQLNNIYDMIDKLQKSGRVTQADIIPGAVKNRHIGEGVNALRAGTADIDVSGSSVPSINQVLTATDSSHATWQTPTAARTDGYLPSSDTWVWVSATSFKITGADRTTIYTKGTKIKCTNNSTTVYGIVSSSSFSTDTTVTLCPTSDYSLNNSAITNPFYSYQSNPQGFPTRFNFAPTWTGFSVNPTGNISYVIEGGMCTVFVAADGNGTSNATTMTMTLPIACGSDQAYGTGIAFDNSTWKTGPARYNVAASATTVTLTTDISGAAWTNANGKMWLGIVSYPI